MSPRLLLIGSSALLLMFVVWGCGEVFDYSDDDALNIDENDEVQSHERGVTSVDMGESVSLVSYRCTASALIPRGDGDACSDLSPVCGDNTPPRLGAPSFLVDGELVDDPRGASADSRIILLIPFEDDECNLACGHDSRQANIGGEKGYGYIGRGQGITPELGCSSTTTGLCFSADLEMNRFGSPLDWTSLDFHVTDVCGARSNTVEVRLDME